MATYIEITPTEVSSAIGTAGWGGTQDGILAAGGTAASTSGGERIGVTKFTTSAEWPTTARIEGVEVLARVRGAASQQIHAELSVDGKTPAAPSSKGKKSASVPSSVVYTEVALGAADDNWAFPLRPEDIEDNPAFTVILYGNAGSLIEIDSVVVRVHLSPLVDNENELTLIFGPYIPENVEAAPLAFVSSPLMEPDAAVALFSTDRYVRENYAHLRSINLTPGYVQGEISFSGGFEGTNLLGQEAGPAYPGGFSYPFPVKVALEGVQFSTKVLNTQISVDALYASPARSWHPLVRPGVVSREYIVPDWEKTESQDPNGCAWFMKIKNGSGQPLVRPGDRIVLIYAVPEHMYGTLETDASSTFPGAETRLRRLKENAGVVAPSKLSVGMDPKVVKKITVNGKTVFSGSVDGTDDGSGYIRRLDRTLKTIDVRDSYAPDAAVVVEYLTPADFYHYRGYRDRAGVFFPFDANPEYGHIIGDPTLGTYRASAECLFEQATLYLIPSAIMYPTIVENFDDGDPLLDMTYYSALSYGESHFVRHLVGQQDEEIQPRGPGGFLNRWGQAVLGRNYYDEEPTAESDIYSKIVPSMLPIAKLNLAAAASVDAISNVDARTRGGGVPEEFPMAAVNAQEDGLDRLRSFLDLGNWEGKAVKDGGVIEIRVDRSLIYPLGDFTEDQIAEVIRNEVPPGIDYEIVFVPANSVGFPTDSGGGSGGGGGGGGGGDDDPPVDPYAERWINVNSPKAYFNQVYTHIADEAKRLQFDGVRMHFSFTTYAPTAPTSGADGWEFTASDTYLTQQVQAYASRGLKLNLILYFGPSNTNTSWKDLNGGATWASVRRPPSTLWHPMYVVYQDVIDRVRTIYAGAGLDPDLYVQFSWWNEPGKGGNGGPHKTDNTSPNDASNYDEPHLSAAYGTWDQEFHDMSTYIVPRLAVGGSFLWGPALECAGVDFEIEMDTFYNAAWMQYLDGYAVNVYRGSSTQRTIEDHATRWDSRLDYVLSRVRGVVGSTAKLCIQEMGFSKANAIGLNHEERGELVLLCMDLGVRKDVEHVCMFTLCDEGADDVGVWGLANYDGVSALVQWYASDLPFARRVLGPDADVPYGEPIW